jgi:lipopolysaccharide export system permease protein
MHRINRYLLRQVLQALALAVVVTTFVMVMASFATLFGRMAEGIPFGPIVGALLLRLPGMLAYTLPVGLLVSVILVFNAMSANHEMTVLRASGISLWQIITPLLLLGILLSGLCLGLQYYWGPIMNHQSRLLLREAATRSPLALLEPRQFMEIAPGILLYVNAKEGEQLNEIRLYRLNNKQQLVEDISAATGRMIFSEAEQSLTLHLENVRIITLDPDYPSDPSRQRHMEAASSEYPLLTAANWGDRPLLKRSKDMTLPELFASIQVSQLAGRPSMSLMVELHRRGAMALAPLSFLLIGIPFGIRIGRRDNASGLVASLIIAALYFALLATFETFSSRPNLHPDLCLWIPNLACQVGGLYGLWLKR